MRRLVAAAAVVIACAACTTSEPEPEMTTPSRPTPSRPTPTSSAPSASSVSPSTSTSTSRPVTPEQRRKANAHLLAAAESGDVRAARTALRAGAQTETRNDLQQTPLLVAATFDRVAVARVLVAAGADPDALDYRHDTPWLVTGVTGSVRMLETLLPANPDLTIRNRFGGLSPIPAAERGHVEYIRRVVRTDVDLDHVNDSGWTALLEAVILGDGGPRHQQVVRILVDAGVDTSIADSQGITALQHARDRGYTEISRILGG
ncbi:ankyrin repeat domain-containing protein [Jatrophihabitans fulvus]